MLDGLFGLGFALLVANPKVCSSGECSKICFLPFGFISKINLTTFIDMAKHIVSAPKMPIMKLLVVLCKGKNLPIFSTVALNILLNHQMVQSSLDM